MKWTFHPIADFERNETAWQTINARGANTPLLHPDFIAPLIKEFSVGDELLAIYGDNTEYQAMALLVRRKPGVWETFQPSQAPLGCWVSESSLPLKPLLRSLLRALPGMPLVVGITQQDPELMSRPGDSGTMVTLDYIQTARITLNNSFDEYWAARGKNLRHNMKRQRNRLEKENIAPRLEVLTNPHEVATAIGNYGRLESAGWKSGMGTAIHPDNSQGRYYKEILERFMRTGDGRIYQYWYGDKLVAIDLCIQRNGILVILKTTYDETITTSSPAFLMRQDSFKQIFSGHNTRKIEFYGKLMDWHTKWSEEVRTLYHVNYYRWPLLPKLFRII